MIELAKIVFVTVGLIVLGSEYVHCAKDDGKPGSTVNTDGIVGFITNLPGNLGDFVTIIIKTIFNPFGWRKEVCGKNARKNKRGKDNSVSLTQPQMDALLDVVRVLPRNLLEHGRIVYYMAVHQKKWVVEYCKANPLPKGM